MRRRKKYTEHLYVSNEGDGERERKRERMNIVTCGRNTFCFALIRPLAVDWA